MGGRVVVEWVPGHEYLFGLVVFWTSCIKVNKLNTYQKFTNKDVKLCGERSPVVNQAGAVYTLFIFIFLPRKVTILKPQYSGLFFGASFLVTGQKVIEAYSRAYFRHQVRALDVLSSILLWKASRRKVGEMWKHILDYCPLRTPLSPPPPFPSISSFISASFLL